MTKTIVCKPKSLPAGERTRRAAKRAFEINPANRPQIEGLLTEARDLELTMERLAASTTKYWGPSGARLTVSFLDNPPQALRTRILAHMNAWNRTANVSFVETKRDGNVRIAREEGAGYWSYLGTDILDISRDEPTMNLDSFTMQTEEAELCRVVRHEAGHTLGFVHEHVRRELVERIDRVKAIAYFRDEFGWPPSRTERQVLTPIEEGSLLGTSRADGRSIMCYQLPGEITIDGEPIIGGHDIDEDDYQHAAKLYPKTVQREQERGLSEGGSPPASGYPVVFLANDDPEFIAAVIAAMRRN